MMRQHLKLTTDEAVARLTGDWSADVRAFDRVHARPSRWPTCSRPASSASSPGASAELYWGSAPVRSHAGVGGRGQSTTPPIILSRGR